MFICLSAPVFFFGCSVIIAQRFGGGDNEGIRKASHTAVASSLIYGAVTTVLLILISPWLLRIMKTPDDIFADSLTYLRTYFAGCLFVMIYNVGANILRAVGDSRRPFIYLAVSCGTNIVLDLLFVAVFHQGVFGVAIATVISQFMSALLVSIKLLKEKDIYGINLRELTINVPFLSSMLRIGVPAMLQSAMYQVANTMVQASVNSIGSETVAAWSLVGKLDGYFYSVTGAAGVALITFIGQNYGAGNFSRIKKSVKSSVLIFIGVTLLFSGAVFLAGPKVFAIFTKDMALMYRAYNIMKIFLPYYFMWTFVEIFSAALRGIGDVVIPVFICAGGIAIFRIAWLNLVFPAYRRIGDIAICFPISWAITAVAMAIRYFTSKRLNSHKVVDRT